MQRKSFLGESQGIKLLFAAQAQVQVLCHEYLLFSSGVIKYMIKKKKWFEGEDDGETREYLYQRDRVHIEKESQKMAPIILLHNICNEYEVRMLFGDMLPTYSYIINKNQSIKYALKKDKYGFFYLELLPT